MMDRPSVSVEGTGDVDDNDDVEEEEKVYYVPFHQPRSLMFWVMIFLILYRRKMKPVGETRPRETLVNGPWLPQIMRY